MPSLNRVQLIGQVTDPLHVHMEGDLKEVVATIMTTEPGRNAATGERWVTVDYHPVEFQGRLAELVAAKAGIGALLFIEASLATESLAGAEGSGLKVTKIKARSVQILQEGAPEAPANTAGPAASAVAAEPAKAPVVAPVVAPIAAAVAAPIATPAAPAAPAAPAVNTAPVAAATQAPRRHFVPGARRAVPTASPAASPAAAPAAAPVAAPAVAAAAPAPTVAAAGAPAQTPTAAAATPSRKWSRGLNRAAAAATA